jgi:NAD(P)-dependent dehydrogenase (short-subunit alcohol dehydrogenase family)
MKKTILITGGSRGIGAATALLAAEKGYNVCINYRENKDLADNIIHRITQIGGNSIAYKADLTSETEVISMFQKIEKDFGSIYGLVNNIGTLEIQSRLDNMELARFQRIIQSNIITNFLCSKEAIKRMAIKYGGKGGSIVNVSLLCCFQDRLTK